MGVFPRPTSLAIDLLTLPSLSPTLSLLIFQTLTSLRTMHPHSAVPCPPPCDNDVVVGAQPRDEDPSSPASLVPLPAVSGGHHHPSPTPPLQQQYCDLAAQLRHQIEFYFSASNLSRDDFLRSLLNSRDHPGAVPVATIASFPRVREIYAQATANNGAGGGGRSGSVPPTAASPQSTGPADPRVVGWSLRGSHLVEVSDDGHWIRPRVVVSGRSHRHPSPTVSKVDLDNDDRRDSRFDGPPLVLASSASSAVTAKGTIPTTTSSSSTTTTPTTSPTSFDSTELSVLQCRDRTVVVWIPNNNDDDDAWTVDASDILGAFATNAGVQPTQAQLVEGGASSAERQWHIIFATEEDAQAALEASRTRILGGTPLRAILLRTALAAAETTTAPPSQGHPSHPIPATVSTTRPNDATATAPDQAEQLDDQDHPPPTIAGHNVSHHSPEHHLYPIPMVPLVGTYPPMPMAPPYGYAPVPTAAAYGFHPQQGYVVGVQTLYHTTSPSYVWAAYPSPAMTSPIPEPHPPHFAPGPVYCSGWEGVAAAGAIEGMNGGFPEGGPAYAPSPPHQLHYQPPFPAESVALDPSITAYMMQYPHPPAPASPPRQRGHKKNRQNRYRPRLYDDVSSSHASNNSTTTDDDDDDSHRGRPPTGGNNGDHNRINNGRGGSHPKHPPRPQQLQQQHPRYHTVNHSMGGGGGGRPPTGGAVANVTGNHKTTAGGTRNASSGDRRGPTRFASPANRSPPPPPPPVHSNSACGVSPAASDTRKKQWPNKHYRSRNPPANAVDRPALRTEREGWSSTDEDFPALSPGSLGMTSKADSDLKTAKTAPPLPYAAAVRSPRHCTPTKGAASIEESINDAATIEAGSSQGGPLVDDFQGLAVSD